MFQGVQIEVTIEGIFFLESERLVIDLQRGIHQVERKQTLRQKMERWAEGAWAQAESCYDSLEMDETIQRAQKGERGLLLFAVVQYRAESHWLCHPVGCGSSDSLVKGCDMTHKLLQEHGRNTYRMAEGNSLGLTRVQHTTFCIF